MDEMVFIYNDMIMIIYVSCKSGSSCRWDILPWTILRYVIHVTFWFSWHCILAGKRSNMTTNMVDYSSWDSPYGSYEQRGGGNSYDLADTLRILKEKIRSCKADSDRIIQAK